MIPDGWKIERASDPKFKTILVQAPNGYTAAVMRMDRNPANILYMLAETLLEPVATDIKELTTFKGLFARAAASVRDPADAKALQALSDAILYRVNF